MKTLSSFAIIATLFFLCTCGGGGGAAEGDSSSGSGGDSGGASSGFQVTGKLTIPKTNTGGTINRSSASLNGVSSSELTGITTNQICHVGLSYDDKPGMRYFEGICDASGTCS